MSLRRQIKLVSLLTVYLIPLLLGIEIFFRMRGYRPLHTKLDGNNNIFKGILDQCIAESDLARRPPSIFPPAFNKINCDQRFTSSVLNIRPNIKTRFKGIEFNTTVETNKYGMRIPNGPLNSEILLLGDSFTFGHGVEGGERFSRLLEIACNQNVLNASYQNGFAPEHYAYWLAMNSNIVPSVIVVNLFVSNDLYSDVLETSVSGDRSRPKLSLLSRSVSQNGQLTSKFDHNGIFQKAVLKLAEISSLGDFIFTQLRKRTGLFGRFPDPSIDMPKELSTEGQVRYDILQRTIAAIKDIYDVSLSRNPEARVVVAVIPDSLTNLDIARMRKVNKIVVSDLRKELKHISVLDTSVKLEPVDFFPNDRHFNKSGHLKYSQLLADNIMSHSPQNCKRP